MAVYYVNSVTGSDSNSGTTEGAAFASLSAVETLKLKPGDSVLLAAGSTFNEQFDLKYSGSVAAPIMIGKYGEGPAPVIHSTGDGIHTSSASNIVVEDIKISDIGGAAIYAGNVSNWTVRNVEIENTGLSGRPGSVFFQNGANVTIQDSQISGVHGDGIFMNKIDGVTVIGNSVTGSLGATADAVQINESSHVVVQGNMLDQTGSDSTKGVIAVVHGQDVLIESNIVLGGNFGVSAQASQTIAIRNNDISGYGGYSWSYAIGLGDQGDARDYDISGNHVHNGVWGVSISAAGNPPYVRDNIDIHENVFNDLASAALKIDRPASGEFRDNVIGALVVPTSISPAIAAAGTFPVLNNITLDEALMRFASSEATHVSDGMLRDFHVADFAGHSEAMSALKGEDHHDGLAEADLSHGTLFLREFVDNGSALGVSASNDHVTGQAAPPNTSAAVTASAEFNQGPGSPSHSFDSVHVLDNGDGLLL